MFECHQSVQLPALEEATPPVGETEEELRLTDGGIFEEETTIQMPSLHIPAKVKKKKILMLVLDECVVHLYFKSHA